MFYRFYWRSLVVFIVSGHPLADKIGGAVFTGSNSSRSNDSIWSDSALPRLS